MKVILNSLTFYVMRSTGGMLQCLPPPTEDPYLNEINRISQETLEYSKEERGSLATKCSHNLALDN